MSIKNRDQVENVVTTIVLLLVVSSGVFLAVVLFLSPSL